MLIQLYIKEDWLQDLGLGTASDIKTVDQLHNALLAFKSAYSTNGEIFPMFFHNCIENAPGAFFGAYNTSSSPSSKAEPLSPDPSVAAPENRGGTFLFVRGAFSPDTKTESPVSEKIDK